MIALRLRTFAMELLPGWFKRRSEFVLAEFEMQGIVWNQKIPANFRSKDFPKTRFWSSGLPSRILLDIRTKEFRVGVRNSKSEFWTEPLAHSFERTEHEPWEKFCNIQTATFREIAIEKRDDEKITEKTIHETLMMKPQHWESKGCWVKVESFEEFGKRKLNTDC